MKKNVSATRTFQPFTGDTTCPENTTPARVDVHLLRELWLVNPPVAPAPVAAPAGMAARAAEAPFGEEDVREPGHDHYAKITLSTLPDGRRSVQFSLRERRTSVRGSGKTFGYWVSMRSEQLLLTKQGLIVHRTFSDKKSITSQHIFSDKRLTNTLNEVTAGLISRLPGANHSVAGREVQREQVQAITDQVKNHLGAVPLVTERMPLMAAMTDRSWPQFAHTYMPYLDAPDYATLAKNLFGIKAYRKPMAGCVQVIEPATLVWFSLFRGLVPPEWIIDAMRKHKGHMPFELSPAKKRIIRRILVRTPQPILRRILAQRAQLAVRPLVDVVLAVANKNVEMIDLDQLPEAITLRGQKHIREASDLEHLIRTLASEPVPLKKLRRHVAACKVLMDEIEMTQLMQRYNQAAEAGLWGTVTWEQVRDPELRLTMETQMQEHQREIMTARQREVALRQEERRLERIAANQERADWATRSTETLQGKTLAGLTVTVATNAAELSRWGNEMANCIGGYARDLELDVFLALTDPETGKVRINAQINHTSGIAQLLGKRNVEALKELGHETAQQLVNELAELGFLVNSNTWGMKGLSIPVLQH